MTDHPDIVERLNAFWYETGVEGQTVCNKAAAEITRLRAEAEALRKDAERYRSVRRGQQWSVIDGIGDELWGEKLDAAVDAAIAATKEQQA